jgi:TonB family protein
MQQASVLTGRQMMMLIVVGLHALVIGVLMTMKLEIIEPPGFVFTSITPVIPDEKPPIEAPELAVDDNPMITRVRLPDLPEPVVRTEEPRSAITPEPSPPAAAADASDSSGGEGFLIPSTGLVSRARLSPDDFYPSASISLGEVGVSVVRVCVGPTGRIEGRPTIRTSSRSRRLDDAAIRWASEALEFTPATRNGAAVSDCKDFRVVFNLR